MSDLQKNKADAGADIDQLFRKGLESYKVDPPARVWKGLNRKLLWNELAHFNFRNLNKTLWIGGSGLLIAGLILMVNLRPDSQNTGAVYSTMLPYKVSKKSNDESLIRNASIISANQPHASYLAGSRGLMPPDPNSASVLCEKLQPQPATRSHSSTFPPPVSFIHSFKREPPALASNQRAGYGLNIHYLPHTGISTLSLSSAEDTVLRFTNLNQITNIPVITHQKTPKFFSFDMGITPEVAVYRTPEQYSGTSYWLNTNLTWHTGRFSIGTGIAAGIIYDHANYQINYKSKDSIGYFTSIVYFTVTSDDLVVYTTKEIAVYDSLLHVADSRALSRHTFIEVPLLLGFDICRSNRFNIAIKAGPAVLFLIGSKEAAPVIDYPNATLVRVENITPSREKINWELQAALDIEYRLVKSFSVYGQPSYKHFFRPFESGEQTSLPARDPYSIGMTIGARYNFGRIKDNGR